MGAPRNMKITVEAGFKPAPTEAKCGLKFIFVLRELMRTENA